MKNMIINYFYLKNQKFIIHMNINMNNIGPIDNRYSKVCEPISEYLSDFGMNKIRCEVEIKYFLIISR